MYRIEKYNRLTFFFKFNNYLFSTGTSITNILHDGRFRTSSTVIRNVTQNANKLDESISITNFSGLPIPLLELQTNSMMVNR